jgi:coproporphyrinogen III oxidase-like Fe-S oxidoreductase
MSKMFIISTSTIDHRKVVTMGYEKEVYLVAQTEYYTGLARLLVLLYLGLNRKVDMIRAGLGSSTIYFNILKGVQLGLLSIKNDKIELTEKGRSVARVLYEAFKEIEKIEGSTGPQ